MKIQTPEWVKSSVFYQIFPDRFSRDGLEKIETQYGKLNLEPWKAPPTFHGYKGGNLWGLTEKLSYLKELGITAIYLNPIFQSACNHRYHTFDYYQVDPLLGGNEAFFYFLEKAHAVDIRVVLDGVFNHASRGFFPFNDVLENGEKSPWKDWFKINDYPVNAYSNGPEIPPNYLCWWNLPALPTLNHENPAVREYIMRVAEYWIEKGIDGWRLDVPEEIKVEGFWQEFRSRVKAKNPEAYICGEIWGDASEWLDGSQFDAVMNYLFLGAIMGFLGSDTLNKDALHGNFKYLKMLDAKKFIKKIEKTLKLYDWQINCSQLNLLDSHDTSRFLTLMSNMPEMARLGAVLLFTLPGVPCIYYGNEVGLEGGLDPDCRRGFPFEESWNHEMLETYKKLIQLRKEHRTLQVGSFESLFAEDRVLAFKRRIGNTETLIAINTGPTGTEIELEFDPNLKPIFGETRMQKAGNNTTRLSLEPFDAVILSH